MSLIRGKEFITGRLGGLTFRLSPNSFYQVNTSQAEKLYDAARKYAGLTGGETVIDAYCGTGTISLYMAGCAARVVGLELVPEAVADARENARLNGIKNTEFKAGPVEKVLPGLLRKGLRPDVVVLDPPRAGCAKELLEVICQTGVAKIVYISCNPATLARDLGRMVARGYRVKEVQPVDMFPWTAHVECVVLMENVKNK